MKIFNEIDSLIRSCLQCGTPFGRIDLYCENCWEKLNEKKSNSTINYYEHLGFSGISLWNWTDTNNETIAKMVYSLKSGKCPEAFRRIANILSERAYALNPPIISNDLCFVPAPAKKGSTGIDHAGVLATELNKIWGGQIFWGLRRTDNLSQKEKSKSERVLSEGAILSDCEPPKGHIVFVDDVITTGSTAKSVKLALNNPLRFEAWTIFNRPLLQ